MNKMNGTEFDQLTAFIATVEYEGFTAAGKVLSKDSTILSRRVTALEKRLGIRLLERTTRHLSLTEMGEAFYQKMRPVIHSLVDIEQETIEQSSRIRGVLRLSLPGTFGRMWVSKILPSFMALYPDLIVETIYEDRYVDLVAESFDAAIRVGDLGDNRLVAKKIAASTRLLCAAPAYIEKYGMPKHPADLINHRCLFFKNIHTIQPWIIRDKDKVTNIRTPNSLITNDGTSLVQAAASGLGIAMVSDWIASDELSHGLLVPVLSDYIIESKAAINVVHPSAKLVPAKTRAFIDWIVDALGQQPWKVF